MERMSAEGLFFHRGCLKCAYCAVSLRLGNYSFEKSPTGERKYAGNTALSNIYCESYSCMYTSKEKCQGRVELLLGITLRSNSSLPIVKIGLSLKRHSEV